MNEQQILQDDEIDLKELFKTLWDKKVFIVSFTCIVTILAMIYAYSKTPIYEAKALIEIGIYTNTNTNILLEDATNLQQKLQQKIGAKKLIKDKEVWLESVTVARGSRNFIELSTRGKSKDLAISELNNIVENIKNTHLILLKEKQQNNEKKIREVNDKIFITQHSDIVLNDNKITILEEDMQKAKDDLGALEENLKPKELKNETLVALQLIQLSNLKKSIIESKMQILDLRLEKEKLLGYLRDLEREKETNEFELLHNFKNSSIVGEIFASPEPVEPKKSLIVAVACITGFILSIFLVFFIQFVRSFRDEK